MNTNHEYNLLRQLVQENESLHHIKTYYQNDSSDCADCQAFWQKLVADKEDHVRELENLVRAHLTS